MTTIGPHYAVGLRAADIRPNRRNGDGDGVLLATEDIDHARGIMATALVEDEITRDRYGRRLDFNFALYVIMESEYVREGYQGIIAQYGDYGIAWHDRPADECPYCHDPADYGL